MKSRPMAFTALVLLAATAACAAFSPAGCGYGTSPQEVKPSLCTLSSSNGSFTTSLYASPTSNDDGTDLSIPYNAAAILAYKSWRAQHHPPKIKASQKVLGIFGKAQEDAYDAPIDAAKFAMFERNYNTVTVANIRAKKAAREYGGVAEIVELGKDADSVEIPTVDVDVDDALHVATDAEQGDADGDDEPIDVSIPYDAAARLAYDEWCQSNGKTADAAKFVTFEKNYVAVTVANVSAKKAARESGSDDAAKLVELGSDADEVVASVGKSSSFNMGGSDVLKKIGTLSFGESFGEALKWQPSTDDRLRSALGIEASGAEDRAFFLNEGEKRNQRPHPPSVPPSDKVIKDNAEERNVVVTEEQKTVAMKTKKALQRDYNITMSYDKIVEILVSEETPSAH